MEEAITQALAVAAIVYTICDSRIAEGLRERFNPYGVFDCTFCTSFWVSVGVTIGDFCIIRCFAMMTIAALGIFVIRLSTAGIEYEEDIH